MTTSSSGLSTSEVKTLHKELTRAIADDAQKDIAVILDKLKEGVVPTEEIIRSTKIGQLVGKLRTNKSSTVASQAKELVQGWKAVIDKERAAKAGANAATSSSAAANTSTSSSNSASAGAVGEGAGAEGNGKSSGGTAAAAASGSSTPSQATTTAAVAPAGSASPAGNASASPIPATSSSSSSAPLASSSAAPPPSTGKKPDFNTLNDKTRNACLKVIFDALKLADVKEVDDSQIFATSLIIESSVFDKTCPSADVTAEYRNKIRSLSLNLKDKNNPQFRRKVVLGQVPAHRLVDLTPKEMASEERLAEYRSLEQQNMLVAQSAAEQTAETDAFQCGRCKQRKCRYYQKQTRSADEPMTTFVTCTHCGNKWKFC